MKQRLCLVLMIFALIACNEQKSSKMLDDSKRSKAQELVSVLNVRKAKGIMLGHQDALAYGSMWYGEKGRSDVKSVCGDYPAVVGWDIANVELGEALNIDSVKFQTIVEYIQITNEMGGVSTISWTARNPVEDSAVQDPVSAILTQKKYKDKYVSYLDKLAAFFIDLKDKEGNHIPVIFRPFHNPNVETYWWNINNCTTAEYKKLWQMTVDYLRKMKKVDNLVFALSLYNPLSTEEILNCYPGDEYVDIIGSDLYLEQANDPMGKMYVENLNKTLAVITDVSDKKNKIPALTDTGMEGIKIPNFFSELVYPVISEYPISYILFGKNAWNIENYYHIPIPGHPASEDFLKFVEIPRILTCNKLDNKG